MKKKLLIHVCCAPCLIAPWRHLEQENELEITALWYNHNIHPYTEYEKRRDTLVNFTNKNEIPLILKDEYGLHEFLRQSVYREELRCEFCYYERLKITAQIARKGNFDAFTTTLLYSKYQKHNRIKELGEKLAREYHVSFYYRDFRELWKEGITLSKDEGMYRQQYCGCIYSEMERYAPKK